jgi:hypothetical protein
MYLIRVRNFISTEVPSFPTHSILWNKVKAASSRVAVEVAVAVAVAEELFDSDSDLNLDGFSEVRGQSFSI